MTPLPVPPESFDGLNFGVSLAAAIVSVLALIIGGYSLGWQIVRHYRWARPRLVVTGEWGRMHEQHSDGRVERDTWTLEVTVTNTGDVGTQIIDVYWEFPAVDDTQRPLRVAGSTDPDEPYAMHVDWQGIITEEGIRDPSIPTRLEPFSRLYWRFEVPASGAGHSQVRRFERGRAAVTWVSRDAVKEPAFGEHPHVRTTYGPWQTFSADHPSRAGSDSSPNT
ncbi:hypothetical protein [Microbacterium sp.]|uniref:hypothetical protein n=1 Tax=Microbacterium sp. TaxID=51671 RepID=UPI0039E514AA